MREVWDLALERLFALARRGFGDRSPLYTDPHTGRWVTAPVAEGGRVEGGRWHHGNWMAGFWPGLLWVANRRTGDPFWREKAWEALRPLAPRATDPSTHDLGFLFWPSFALGYALTGDRSLRETALQSARTLAGRIHPGGGYLQAWGPFGDPDLAGTSTIDTMMNLPLLWWAWAETAQDPFREVADTHAFTTAHNLVREDGSTVHLGVYDPATGRLRERRTFQGHSPDSCWSRGQAWALAGFALAWRGTGRWEFLETARRTADFFLAHLPPDGLPYWDFRDPAVPHAPRDSSALAVAVWGLQTLAEADPAYGRQADRLLGALVERALDREGRTEGLLLHACYSWPHREGVGGAFIVGDFFFLCALLRREEGVGRSFLPIPTRKEG